MNQGGKEKGKPLLVKEVILPHGQVMSGESKNWSENDKEILEGSLEIACHRYRKDDQQEADKLSLLTLKEKPLENYFEGTRKRKTIRKRKKKNNRSVISSTELSSSGAQTLSEGELKQTEKALSEEEKTEIQLLSLKIYEYEKTREEEHRKNYIRQRKAEEDYICQLESLAKMWFKTGKRRQVTKKADDDLSARKFLEKSSEGTSKKRTKRRTKKKTSTSIEGHSKDSVPPTGKSEKLLKEKLLPPVQEQPSDGALEEDFHEKLVFVNDESDEFDYSIQKLVFRNSSG